MGKDLVLIRVTSFMSLMCDATSKSLLNNMGTFLVWVSHMFGVTPKSLFNNMGTFLFWGPVMPDKESSSCFLITGVLCGRLLLRLLSL